MPTCAKCGENYPVLTLHSCSSDIKPSFQKMDRRTSRTYRSRDEQRSQGDGGRKGNKPG
jgi:hypothetical protein